MLIGARDPIQAFDAVKKALHPNFDFAM